MNEYRISAQGRQKLNDYFSDNWAFIIANECEKDPKMFDYVWNMFCNYNNPDESNFYLNEIWALLLERMD